MTLSAIGINACQQQTDLCDPLRSVHVLHLLVRRDVKSRVQPGLLASAAAKVAVEGEQSRCE